MEYMCHMKHLKELQEGSKAVVTIRDLSPGKHKYLARVARVEVSRSPEALSKWDQLWAYSVVGRMDPKPWGMKILEIGRAHV